MRLAAPLLVTLLAGAAAAQDASAGRPGGLPDPGLDLGRAAAWLTERLAPSIVEVEALGGLPERHAAPQSEEEAGGGVLVRKGFKQAFGPSTGVVVSADGLIVTSTFALARQPRHVVVTLADGRAFVARPLGRDEARGLALLRIDAEGLTVPEPAEAEAARPGRFAFALGRGLGAAQPTIAQGIVSAQGRLGGLALQTSARVSPVNYGGPLVALDGRVLGLIVPLALHGGMASQDLYDSGIGFAIPWADVLASVPRLAGGETLAPAFLGVVPDPTHRGGGVRVAEVASGSPAAQAKLREGDVIRAVDEHAVDAPWQLVRALARRHAGDGVELTVEWQGEPRTVHLRLGERPAPGP